MKWKFILDKGYTYLTTFQEHILALWKYHNFAFYLVYNQYGHKIRLSLFYIGSEMNFSYGIYETHMFYIPSPNL